MTIYEKWIQTIYDGQGGTHKKPWEKYLVLEQRIYEDMLETKNPHITGSILELAKKHNMPEEFFVGFLDGISAALTKEIDVQEIDSDSEIDITVDFETLYKKMIEYKANHLAELPQWSNFYSKDEREAMKKEYNSSRTIVREGDKIGRNDPCPCGSGKKYKKCCASGIK